MQVAESGHLCPMVKSGAIVMSRSFKRVSNVGISSRWKQFCLLVVIIIIGMLLSHAVDAQDYQRKNARYNKARYRAQVKTQKRACVLLFKRWVKEPKQEKVVVASRKIRHRPMAEMDSPANRSVTLAGNE